MVQPSAVLASGDLTDGKEEDGVGSRQIPEEWDTYAALLRNNSVQNKTLFLDIRGNHDAFDVPHVEHASNLHRLYSGRGAQHPSSYVASLNYGEKTIRLAVFFIRLAAIFCYPTLSIDFCCPTRSIDFCYPTCNIDNFIRLVAIFVTRLAASMAYRTCTLNQDTLALVYFSLGYLFSLFSRVHRL
jgi:hypothetical protein